MMTEPDRSQEAMRVTLECGHLQLTRRADGPHLIGAVVECLICDPLLDWRHRMVVNIEPTGVAYSPDLAPARTRGRNRV